MNVIQRTKLAGWKYNRLLNVVVTIINYKKSRIDRDIYIKLLSNGTVAYLTVSNYDFLNSNNNETGFPELKKTFG